MKQIYFLVHDLARANAIAAVKAAPDGWCVEVKERTRTLDQNSALHAALTDISRQVQWQGEWMDVEDWKRLMTAAWARAEREPVKLVPALDGNGFDVLYRRTSKMKKSEVSSLLDYLHAWGSDHGVHWSDIACQEVA